MKKRVTDSQIRKFFWRFDKIPSNNKASYLLGDLSNYGVSRCKKFKKQWAGVWYEFDIYRDSKSSVVTLVVELPTDFRLKDIEKALINLYVNGGMIASNNVKTFYRWDKKVKPVYHHEHAKYSANRFLEALRKKLLPNKTASR